MTTQGDVILGILVLSFFGGVGWMIYDDLQPQTPTHENTTETYSLPKELKECKIFDIKSSSGSKLHVVKCPQSSTTTGWTTTHRRGKSTITEDHSVTVD